MLRPDTPTHETLRVAAEILAGTQDGDNLSNEDLGTLSCLINGGCTSLTEKGLQRMNDVHKLAQENRYPVDQPLYGIEHLTKNSQGYVKWKGVEVEHYSFTSRASEMEAAHRLARICRHLESTGQEVNALSVSNTYKNASYGEGLNTPRAHVFWRVSKGGAQLEVRPSDIGQREAASKEAKSIIQRLDTQWPRGTDIRHMVITTSNDLEACRRNLQSDANWAVMALGMGIEHASNLNTLLSRRMAGITPLLPNESELQERYFQPLGGTNEHELTQAPQCQ